MSQANEDEFRTLYEWTRPRIIAYAMRRTSSPEDAADIVAETYEIAWRKLSDIPTGQAGLLWLYVTARYVLANHNRRHRRRDELTVRLAGELRSIPPRVEALDENHLLMQSAFNSLAPSDRELLMLAGWEGLSASELGRVLGCSPTAARIRLHRARAQLKAFMSDGSVQPKQLLAPEHEQRNNGSEISNLTEVSEQ